MTSNIQGEISTPYKLIKNLPIEDGLGKIVVYNDFSDLPFMPKRFFTVTNNEVNVTRGAHAHKSCEQVLFAIQGSIELQIDDGKAIHKILMNSSSQAVYIPIMLWSEQTYLSNSSILGVFASEPYNEAEYIRSYEVYKKLLDNN
jgi:dTDP-4-dehydrorhamnose 3,5-epimerase-like enzyme